MIHITFNSDYFSGSQTFSDDKKAEKFLLMLKKNHDITVKPVISTNKNTSIQNEYYKKWGSNRGKERIQPLKEVPQLKIQITHGTH